MESEPLVSIITPTYNRGHILSQAVNSIINQTYQNWELLIVDDRSTDDTREIVNKLAESDKRIKYLSNIRNKGPAGTRNHGILNSKGEYIAFLDSDDLWLPHHLTDAVRVLTNEDVNVCYAICEEMHSGTLVKFAERPEVQKYFPIITTELKARIKDDLYFFGNGYYEMATLDRAFHYHLNTWVIHKSVIQKVGLFNENLVGTEDTDLFLRTIYDNPFCFIFEAHAIYNESPDALFSFIDRSKCNADEVSNNQELIKKLTHQGNDKNLMRKLLRRFILKSDKIKDKRYYRRYLAQKTAQKYLLLGFINRKEHKISAINYYLKSIFYDINWRKLVYIGGVICPPLMSSIRIDPSSFDFT